MKNILASFAAFAVICSMTSCGGKSESTDTTAKSTTTTGQTTTAEETMTSETTTSAETTTTTTKATTAETTTTTTAKQFDTSYYEFGYEKDMILKYDTSLYSAPDKSSEKLYDFSKDTVLVAVGETSDWYAVIMNDDVVFCEKVASEFYISTTTTTTTATTPMPDMPEPYIWYVIEYDENDVFHHKDCQCIDGEETTMYFMGYDDMINCGFTPCDVCCN